MNPKNLGQHFLINHTIAQREVAYAQISIKDVVLEIGAGKGILTQLLAKKCKKVIAIEIDDKYVTYLRSLLPKNVEIVHADAVSIDFSLLPKFTKIVSNLPYQISSPITFKLLSIPFEKAVLIYQKEFAQRMIAQCGDSAYSRLSVGVYYKSLCTVKEFLSPNCFSPQPRIESAIVELIPRKTPPFIVDDEQFFFNLTTLLFTHRRKKIKTILTKVYPFEPADIPLGEKRVEQLSPEDIGKLSNQLLAKLSLQ